MPAGQPFTVSIKDGDKVAVGADARHARARTCARCRSIFRSSGPVQERLKDERAGVQRSGVPLELKVEHLAGRRRQRALEQLVQAARARRHAAPQSCCSMAARAGRARYLRNMFERDEQWEINAGDRRHCGGRKRLRARRPAASNFPTDPALLAALRSHPLRRSAARALQGRGTAGDCAISWRNAAARSPSSMARAARCSEYADTPLGAAFPGRVERRDASARRHHAPRPAASAALGARAFRARRRSRAERRSLAQRCPCRTGSPAPRRCRAAEVFVEAEVPGGKVPAVVVAQFRRGQRFLPGVR